jgi:hypothetical protein
MSQVRRNLADPVTLRKFKDWMMRNCISRDEIQKIDFEAEFGKDLTYNEAIEVALHKFPTLWSPEYMREYEDRPKQIIFIRDLVTKIVSGKIQVTYRKSPKLGVYYVIENRFKQKAQSARLFIEFYKTDKVDAYKLSDEEAQLAGVNTGDEIRKLFEKWYGTPIPLLYRNWFKIKEVAGQ